MCGFSSLKAKLLRSSHKTVVLCGELLSPTQLALCLCVDSTMSKLSNLVRIIGVKACSAFFFLTCASSAKMHLSVKGDVKGTVLVLRFDTSCSVCCDYLINDLSFLSASTRTHILLVLIPLALLVIVVVGLILYQCKGTQCSLTSLVQLVYTVSDSVIFNMNS